MALSARSRPPPEKPLRCDGGADTAPLPPSRSESWDSECCSLRRGASSMVSFGIIAEPRRSDGCGCTAAAAAGTMAERGVEATLPPDSLPSLPLCAHDRIAASVHPRPNHH